MKFFTCLLIGLFFSPIAFAQMLKGKITDANGGTIASASIYIEETKQGVIGDKEGNFQIKLVPGTYHLECSCVGYDTKKKEITIADKDLAVEFVLSEKIVGLPEVIVTTGEDPAYAIMRKAIEKAPYYQSVVKESTYEAYTKGSGKLVSSPKIYEEELNYYKDKTFMQESVSKYKFTAPDKYEQTIKAYSSTMPNSVDPKDALSISMISLYQPMIGAFVSPLNPKAFSFYRFRYEGYDEENGQIINKIRIIPKLKDPKLMEGLIYIADDDWNIRYAEYTVYPPLFQMHFRLNYHPVMKGIYLVTNSQAGAKINTLGIKGNMDFLSSIQYTDIQLNDSLIAVENSKKKPEKRKKGLEIKEDDRIKKTVDSIAVHRDSVYWSEVRTIALNEEEQMSYVRKDSVQAHVDSVKYAKENPKFKFSDILTGGSLGRDSAFVRFNYSGLIDLLSEYNFVDGVWLGQSFSLDFKRKKNTGIIIEPSVYWASARKTFIWKTDFTLDYAPRKLGCLQFSTGKTSEDYSGNAGIDRFINAAYSMTYGKNYAMFYEKIFGKISNQVEIANGLQLSIDMEYANRNILENYTTWNIFGIKDKWRPNTPEYGQPLNETYSRLAEGGIRLLYTPEYYYRIVNGQKRYVHSRFPTFMIDFHQGIGGFSGADYSTFSCLELGVKQTVPLGIFEKFSYRLVAGKFLNTNPFNYIDYKHFNTGGNIWLNFSDWSNSYALLPLYTYSTNRNWVQAFATYQTDYLIIKRLPFLQGKLFTESIHAKFLHTPDKKYYSEWGYSVNLFANTAVAGVFFSFDSFRYNAFGLQLSFPLFGKIDNRREAVVAIR
ncbi:MAG: DUF5686 and carboxypeptidase regulatory-like domain-containing protein [Candidatus Azobacteroides sp.]|nr:DUF5686 and carboxypeptidase regulatory-like domain-containing protein [Candidatus Azobacteroides sp.]